MTLVERTRTLNDRCARIQDLNARVDEARELDDLLVELRSSADEVASAVAVASLLRGAGVECAGGTDVSDRQAKRFSRMRARFSEKPQAASLKQGRDWSQLMADLASARAEFEATAKAAWKTHVNSLYRGLSTDAHRRNLPKTDANNRAIAQHETSYREFQRLGARLPQTPEDIATAQAVAATLTDIKFDLNVPPSVKKFLDAVPGGASLDLFDDEVRRWLAENNQTERYQIVAARP